MNMVENKNVFVCLQDLTGQNSNDSSSGPAPGTPNSQGMRPTPSPTGSTGSRSMSPAVGESHFNTVV